MKVSVSSPAGPRMASGSLPCVNSCVPVSAPGSRLSICLVARRFGTQLVGFAFEHAAVGLLEADEDHRREQVIRCPAGLSTWSMTVCDSMYGPDIGTDAVTVNSCR